MTRTELTKMVMYLGKAAPSFLVIMALGKFHGVIMPTTPIGCLMNIICLELLTAGTTYSLGSNNVEIMRNKLKLL